VGRVKVRIGSTGQIFETPKGKAKAFSLTLDKGEEAVVIRFEKVGFKAQKLTVQPVKDLEFAIKMERKPSMDPKPDNSIKLDPIKSVTPKKKETPTKLNRIKDF
jgi:hypothetical protein